MTTIWFHLANGDMFYAASPGLDEVAAPGNRLVRDVCYTPGTRGTFHVLEVTTEKVAQDWHRIAQAFEVAP